jgi:hypothetical protein
VSLGWSSLVLWGISGFLTGAGEGLIEDLLLSLGKGFLALILIVPLVWFGSSETGLKDIFLQRIGRKGEAVKAVGNQPVG